MTKKEFLNLINELQDDDTIDEKLPEREVTFEQLKKELQDNKEFRGYVLSMQDARVSNAIESWKKNNLDTLLNEEIEKRKNNELTPEQKRIADLEKRLEEKEKKELFLDKRNKYTNILNEKKLPTQFIDYIVVNGEEEDSVIDNKVSNIETIITGFVSDAIKEKIKNEGTYTPPKNDPEGGEKAKLEKMRDRFKRI